MGYQNFFATRLSTEAGASDTTLTLETAPTEVSGRLVLEARNPTQREIISYTGVSGNQVTGVARGQGGTTAKSHTKNSLVEMNLTAEDLEEALAVPNTIETIVNEIVNDHVASGLIWSADTGLNGDMTAGVAYINGIRLSLDAVNDRAFTASKDTYVDLGDNGVLDYNEVSNGAAAPALSASHIRLARVVTSGAAITGVTNFVVGAAFEKSNGWTNLPIEVSSVTNNGNHSFDVTFASTVASYLTPGMRLRLSRTVAAPTQCTDLEASSSQYYSKTSPAGLTFTTTFTTSAWVKLESYALGYVITRRNSNTEGWSLRVNADGTVECEGLRIAANNKSIKSYQSLPLNKWVHIAACIDMTAADTSAQKIWFDGVEVPRAYTLTGTATALVQGTTALSVGARSDGNSPFDGKIAQAAVFSACLSDATVKAMMSQGLTGSETNLVSAYSFNNSINDLNANANDLTAQGSAVATNADSPFALDANGTPDGTYEWGIVTKVNGATATVQTPEGSMIPETGGISAVAYSNHKAPFGMPVATGKWAIDTILKAQYAASGVSTGNFTYSKNQGELSVPIGSWKIEYIPALVGASTSANDSMASTLSSSSSTVAFASEEDTQMTLRATSQVNGINFNLMGVASKFLTLSAQTSYYRLVYRSSANVSTINWDNDNHASYIRAEFALL